jgi:hypothetical protein
VQTAEVGKEIGKLVRTGVPMMKQIGALKNLRKYSTIVKIIYFYLLKNSKIPQLYLRSVKMTQ